MSRENAERPRARRPVAASIMTTVSRFGRVASRVDLLAVLLLAAAGCSGGGLKTSSPDGGSKTPPPEGGSETSPPDGGSTLEAPDGGHVVATDLVPRATGCASDSECGGVPGACAEVVPGGYRVCVDKGGEVTAPSAIPGQCDGTRPCATGKCYAGQFYPSGACGLGGVSPENVCRSDECATDADCHGGICGPSGLSSGEHVSGGDVRQCFAASCRSNMDCAAAPGGVCSFIPQACVGSKYFAAQVACVYPGGCTSTADCCNGTCGICEVVGGRTVCVKSQ
jgi:hypothetical protein